ncbi:MAG: hypothetical protein Fur0028_02850 [Bacteroidales bacterium]
MKITNKFLLFLILVLLTSLGCKKIKLYTSDEYYLENNTDDTLKIICAEKLYTYSFSLPDTFKHNFILLKQKFMRLSSPSEYFYFDIRYKNIDIRFSPDTLVNNYKVNFFNLQNWEKTNQVDFVEDEYGTKRLNATYVKYYFQFDTLKIINKNKHLPDISSAKGIKENGLSFWLK